MTLRVAGEPVESPSGLWHVSRDATRTFCGEDCSDWPSVPDAVDRGGIWCGACLHACSSVA